MKNYDKILSQRTALVYMGAAILIVVVGVRTLLLTTEEGWTTIAMVTIGALAVEFLLLLLYAHTIYKQGLQPAKETFPDTLNIKAQELESKLDGVIKSNATLVGSLDRVGSKGSIELKSKDLQEEIGVLSQINSGLVDSVKELRVQLEESDRNVRKQNQEIVKLVTGVQSLLKREVRSEIRNEIERILKSAITDEGLASIAKLSTLADLWLTGGKVTDEGLRQLATLHNLEMVGLEEMEYKGRGIGYLKDLPISCLMLNQTPVDDSVVEPLLQMKQLGCVHLVEHRISREGIKRLEESDSQLWVDEQIGF